MASARDFDGTIVVACIALALMMMRSINICSFLFLSINLNMFRVAAVQAQGQRSTSPPQNVVQQPVKRSLRIAFSGRKEHGMICPFNKVTSPINAYPATKSPQQPQSAPPSNKGLNVQSPNHQQPPPPYTFSAPQTDSKQTGTGAIIELYEDIMASDAQTIQVQQQTMASQQDIIRSQAQMILKMRHVLDEQDRRIEELEDAARGLRVRRLDAAVAPRSRSS